MRAEVIDLAEAARRLDEKRAEAVRRRLLEHAEAETWTARALHQRMLERVRLDGEPEPAA